jgi:GNAT superfamily N-acetyltransferase
MEEKTVNVGVNYTQWGTIRYYTEWSRFRFAMYNYDDDESTEYLSNVYVEKDYRGHGIGNGILKMAEDEASLLGSKYLMLRALKDSWMHDWYKRHGYEDFQIDEDFPEFIWMKKELQ